MTTYTHDISSTQITSEIPWIHILFFGAIHGNEVCWPKALNQIIQDFESHKIELKSGKVTFVPICNNMAYNQWKRYIDVNLNRVIEKHENPSNYEENLANILTGFIDDCDILLDIHSTHSDDAPFVFLDSHYGHNVKLAKWLWVENIVVWWAQMYAGTHSPTTQFYANKNKKSWVTIECGNHNHTDSVAVAKNAILNTLMNFGLIDWKPQILENFNEITVQEFVIKQKEWKFIKEWNHLDFAHKWDIVAVYDDWEEVTMPYDWYILLPFSQAKIWDEWIYFWKMWWIS